MNFDSNTMEPTTLKVNEIFYSLQGEGSRTGEPVFFIRLAKCNLACDFCDTEYKQERKLTLEEIYKVIGGLSTKCRRIVWTGGEPLLQLTEGIIQYFHELGYKQSLETNGTMPLPIGMDYVSCSPKVTADVLHVNFEDWEINEFRFLIGNDEDGIHHVPIPIKELPKAFHYYVSPLFVGEPEKKLKLDKANLKKAIEFVKKNPEWKLSVQIHKILGFQ